MVNNGTANSGARSRNWLSRTSRAVNVFFFILVFFNSIFPPVYRFQLLILHYFEALDLESVRIVIRPYRPSDITLCDDTPGRRIARPRQRLHTHAAKSIRFSIRIQPDAIQFHRLADIPADQSVDKSTLYQIIVQRLCRPVRQIITSVNTCSDRLFVRTEIEKEVVKHPE